MPYKNEDTNDIDNDRENKEARLGPDQIRPEYTEKKHNQRLVKGSRISERILPHCIVQLKYVDDECVL